MEGRGLGRGLLWTSVEVHICPVRKWTTCLLMLGDSSGVALLVQVSSFGRAGAWVQKLLNFVGCCRLNSGQPAS